jgi:hypothetical protein
VKRLLGVIAMVFLIALPSKSIGASTCDLGRELLVFYDAADRFGEAVMRREMAWISRKHADRVKTEYESADAAFTSRCRETMAKNDQAVLVYLLIKKSASGFSTALVKVNTAHGVDVVFRLFENSTELQVQAHKALITYFGLGAANDPPR